MRKTVVLNVLKQFAAYGQQNGMTADEMAKKVGIQRHNASADLNELCREGLAVKSKGRPVRFWAVDSPIQHEIKFKEVSSKIYSDLDGMIGAEGSLKEVIEQAKAAIVYPPNGLPVLISGPTGVGKSFLAEAMYKYAVRIGILKADAPFNIFNCADYASNPQLLLSQLFGHVKGAFTGADKDNPGIMARSEGGILLLDEVHRLPPEGQEMLFLLMDKGIYKSLGDTATVKKASIRLIAATSEAPKSSLLKTFIRRFIVTIYLPSLAERPQTERLAMIEYFFKEEASRIGATISVSPLVLSGLLAFDSTGNIGEIRSIVQIGCAKAFLHNAASESGPNSLMSVCIADMPPQVQLAYFGGHEAGNSEENLVGLDDRLFSPVHETDVSIDQDEWVIPYSVIKKRIDRYLKSGLTQYEIEQLINTEINFYLKRLLQFYKGRAEISVPNNIHDCVERFVNSVAGALGCQFSGDVVTNLSLYFASAQTHNTHLNIELNQLLEFCVKEYSAVEKFILPLEESIGYRLSLNELIFISMFLSSHERQKISCKRIHIAVLCHGNKTASSMVEVAASLIGYDCIIAVDMPLDQSVEKTLDITLEKLKQLGPCSGILLLVDMGSLTNFKPQLESALNTQVDVIPLVTTVAVIEATRLAAQQEETLGEIVQKLKRIYQSDETDQMQISDKSIIITTCLTGKGTARRLVSYLYEALPNELRENVIIRPMDEGNGSEIPELMLEGWKGSVIAAVGTFDPHLPKVCFIGIEEILFGDGLKRLTFLLDHADADTDAEGYSNGEVSRDEAVSLACRFICESAMTGNRERAAETAVQTLKALELKLNREFNSSQVARFIIHFAFMLERLSTDGLISTCSEMDYLQENYAGLLESISQVTNTIEDQWKIEIPRSEIGFLALILLPL